MSTITSINSSASSVSQTRHRPDASTMASALLKKVDTDGTGTISQAELETTLKDASGSDASSSAASLMKGLDSDGDGSISKQELTDGLQKLSDQFDAQFNASRTSHVGGPPPGGGHRGPPPADDSGNASSDSAVSSTSSATSSASSSSATSYDAADINQDGTISAEERQAYQQKQTEKNGSADAASAQDRGLSHILKQLAQMYGSSASDAQGSSSLSVTA
jgi:Ca2+-binding EF-hand superfamily protein